MFDAYSENLRKQPEIWKKINAEHSKLAGGFAQLGNKMDAHFSGLQDLQNVEEDREKTLTHSAALWSGIEKASANTTKSIISGTTSLLKWAGIMSGATGLLGYFSLHGMMGLGASVFGQRKSAMGLGLSIGQQRAFDIAFGRLLGSPEGFLGGINQAVSNVAAQGPLLALGVNPNASTGSVAVSTLEALRGLTGRTPTNQLGILESMYQLGNLGIGVEDLRRLKAMSGGEFNQLLGTYRREQGALNIGDRTSLAWTNFLTTMDLAKSKIENVFVNGLVPLTGPLQRLAGGVTHLLQVVMAKNGPIAKDINSIASWMDSFNGQITQPKFISGLERFVNIVSAIGSFGNDTPPTKTTLLGGPAPGSFWSPGSHWRSEMDWALGMRGRRSHWLQFANKLDPSGLLATVGNLESGMNPYVRDSSKGAEGMMQIMPQLARDAGINPYDPEQSLEWANKQLGNYYSEYRGDVMKILAAYNWGPNNLNRDIAQYGGNWQQHVPAETAAYLARALKMILSGAIKVDIHNATGGSAIQSVAGLGATR